MKTPNLLLAVMGNGTKPEPSATKPERPLMKWRLMDVGSCRNAERKLIKITKMHKCSCAQMLDNQKAGAQE